VVNLPKMPRLDRRMMLLPVALPAAVAVWSGWVGLGEKTGFGVVEPFPGIVDWKLNTAITLPIGVEAYAAIALAFATAGREVSVEARRFAWWSAWSALAIGCAGQATYHLLAADADRFTVMWFVTLAVSMLPVLVLGAAFYLFHLTHGPAKTVRDKSRDKAPAGPAASSVPQEPSQPARVAREPLTVVPAPREQTDVEAWIVAWHRDHGDWPKSSDFKAHGIPPATGYRNLNKIKEAAA
jgi:hypothetical protein